MPGDRTGARDALWRLASQQRGYITAAQALSAGYSYQAQHFHSRRGNWTRVDRGLYRLREFDHLPAEGDEQYVRWSLWSRDRAVVSHLSALSIHDLGIANPAEIHLTVPTGFRQSDRTVVLHRADLAPDDVEHRPGFRVTTPLRAICESAATGTDQDVIDTAVADLLERGLATRRQLLHAAQRLGPRAELGVERALKEYL
jgi:hypothetical protein